MTYQVDIKDKVNNYPLKGENGFLFCLFEAVSNSLFSCKNEENITIDIIIKREYVTNEINKTSKDDFIQSLTIIDNGEGFTSENFNNFSRKIEASNYGGKGLGRLSYLKVFNNINIESVFVENRDTYKRVFNFNEYTLPIEKKQQTEEKRTTKVLFNNIIEKYKKHTKKDIEYYFDELIKHFYIFLYYLKDHNKSFSIKITDDNGKIITKEINNKLLENDEIQKDIFFLKEFETEYIFEITNIKTTNISYNNSFYVVDMRSVGNNILQLPPTTLKDRNGKNFNYYVYLKSNFLNKYLNSSRTEINLPTEEIANCISKKQILEKLQEKVNNFLSYEIAQLNKDKEKKVEAIFKRPENNIIFNNEKILNVIFQNEYTKNDFLNKISFTNINDKKTIQEAKNFIDELKNKTIYKINEITEKIDKIEKSELENKIIEISENVNLYNAIELSSYILYRNAILNLFEKSLEKYKNNKKQNEKFFHNLFFTQRTNNAKNSNMWLLDDQFLYFEGTSETEIRDIKINGEKIIRENLTNEENKYLNEFNKKRLKNRVDLFFFMEKGECIIIELKDPKADLNENISQLDIYVQRIANFIKKELKIENFFTYLITDNFNKYSKPTGYKKIHSLNGFVRNSIDVTSYEDNSTIANQYSEVITHTDIFKRANQRNKIFFEKMGI
jgi:hypothetical protein